MHESHLPLSVLSKVIPGSSSKEKIYSSLTLLWCIYFTIKKGKIVLLIQDSRLFIKSGILRLVKDSLVVKRKFAVCRVNYWSRIYKNKRWAHRQIYLSVLASGAFFKFENLSVMVLGVKQQTVRCRSPPGLFFILEI